MIIIVYYCECAVCLQTFLLYLQFLDIQAVLLKSVEKVISKATTPAVPEVETKQCSYYQDVLRRNRLSLQKPPVDTISVPSSEKDIDKISSILPLTKGKQNIITYVSYNYMVNVLDTSKHSSYIHINTGHLSMIILFYWSFQLSGCFRFVYMGCKACLKITKSIQVSFRF